MKKGTDRLLSVSLGVILFIIGMTATNIIMPKEFFSYHNSDRLSSPVGLRLSKSYYEFPELVKPNNQGYINNGEYNYYKNWPPGGFISLAYWFNLTKNTSIYNARIFSSIIYSLTGLLLFLLLLKSNLKISVAFFSTLIFFLLPINLDSSYYTFSDIWVNFFWVLGLICFRIKSHWRWWGLGLISLIGMAYHWFIILILPSAVIYYYLNSKKRFITIIAFLSILQVLSFYLFNLESVEISSTPLLRALRSHSSFGFNYDPTTYTYRGFKNLIFLGYNSAVISFIYIINAKYDIKYNLKESSKSFIFKYLVIISISLTLLVFFFLQWTANHRHFLIFFSIPITLISALILEKLHCRLQIYRIGTSAVALCILQFMIMTRILENRHSETRKRDFRISKFINENHDEAPPPFVVFDISSKSLNKRAPLSKYAIREFTNSYIFDLNTIGERRELKNALLNGNKKLREIKPINYSGESGYFVTDLELITKYKFVTDHAEFNNVFIYRVDLSSILR